MKAHFVENNVNILIFFFQIAHYKVPKYVEFVTDYPKTVSGKIQKYKLRKIMEEKLTNEADMKSTSIN